MTGVAALEDSCPIERLRIGAQGAARATSTRTRLGASAEAYTTSLSAADSGVQTSPVRPWIWRTSDVPLDDLNDSNCSVAGLNRSIACPDHSETQILSLSST